MFRGGNNLVPLINNHVLSTMVDPCFTHTKTCEPCASPDSCDVHDSLLDRIFSRKKTLHYLQRSVSSCCIFNLL